jgi:hypothetical protein
MSVVLRDVWPELAGHGRSGGAAAQTQKCNEALRAPWEVIDDCGHAPDAVFEREAIQQPNARPCGRVHGVSPLVASC